MRKAIAIIIIIFLSVACSAKERLELPPIPDPPADWDTFNLSSASGTICPNLEGKYAEPPLINRSEKRASVTTVDNFDLYSSYIPFHLADRRELVLNDIELASDHFVIQQPDETQFHFLYLNERTKSLVEYHFQATEETLSVSVAI